MSSNKEMVKKLRDNAELAWAAYGYFHLIGKKFKKDEEYGAKSEAKIILYDILDSTYKGYVTSEHTTLINPEMLKGDFAPTQAKNFFEKYDLLIHQPNTNSGFSATLFQDKESKEYIFSIRGTELNDVGDIKADMSLTTIGSIGEQYSDMLLFYRQCIGEIPFYVELDSMPQDKKSLEYELWLKLYQRSKESKYNPYIKESFLKDSSENPVKDNFIPPIDSTTKFNIVGHSLGGCLTQFFTLYLIDDKKSNIINEVYTFNAPSIHSWFSKIPNPNIALSIATSPNAIKILQEILNKRSIDISDKLTHIYDESGLELIASAQYGTSNRISIRTGRNSHSIIPLTQTLYLYSYLLELQANQEKIIKNDSLQETINRLNAFMDNIKTYTDTFITKNSQRNKQNPKDKNLKDLDFLEYFFSQIAFIMQESKEYSNENYSIIYQHPIIKNEQIIEFILQVQEKEKYILMLTQKDYDKFRKDCSFINNQENLAYKIAIGEFRIFVVVNQEMKCLENKNNVSKIYGYKSKIYIASNEVWNEQYLGGVCKVSQSLYFNGKAKIGIA